MSNIFFHSSFFEFCIHWVVGVKLKTFNRCPRPCRFVETFNELVKELPFFFSPMFARWKINYYMKRQRWKCHLFYRFFFLFFNWKTEHDPRSSVIEGFHFILFHFCEWDVRGSCFTVSKLHLVYVLCIMRI